MIYFKWASLLMGEELPQSISDKAAVREESNTAWMICGETKNMPYFPVSCSTGDVFKRYEFIGLQ